MSKPLQFPLTSIALLGMLAIATPIIPARSLDTTDNLAINYVTVDGWIETFAERYHIDYGDRDANSKRELDNIVGVYPAPEVAGILADVVVGVIVNDRGEIIEKGSPNWESGSPKLLRSSGNDTLDRVAIDIFRDRVLQLQSEGEFANLQGWVAVYGNVRFNEQSPGYRDPEADIVRDETQIAYENWLAQLQQNSPDVYAQVENESIVTLATPLTASYPDSFPPLETTIATHFGVVVNPQGEAVEISPPIPPTEDPQLDYEAAQYILESEFDRDESWTIYWLEVRFEGTTEAEPEPPTSVRPPRNPNPGSNSDRLPYFD